MNEYVMPIRIIKEENVINSKALLKKKELQIGLNEPDVTIFNNNSYIILDFKKEMNGGIRILTFFQDNCKVHVRFGESLSECCSNLKEDTNATNDHSIRDFYFPLTNYSDFTVGQTGYRFIRLDFEGTCKIKTIIGTNNILKRKAIYKYSGKDSLISKIYNVAKRTIDLCAANGYIYDGIKRDRLVWIGDIYPEMLALTALYGKCKEVEKSLDFVVKQTPLPGWMNGYPMYSMWWIIILEDYRTKTNSNEYALKQMDYLNNLIKQMNDCVLEDGTLNYPSYFVDWPTSGKEDELDGVRAINIIAMQKAICLLSVFHKDTTLANNILLRLKKKEINCVDSKQVIGLKYFAEYDLSIIEKQKLLMNGVKGISTFMSYFIFKAIASFDKDKAIEMAKEYYGAMLKIKATTFFEDFDIDWIKDSCNLDELPSKNQKDFHSVHGDYCYKGFRHSLCHGWSSGILAFIKEECE